ncbi:MAG: hypothetical protein ACKOW8_03190 [Flavobacteriales bacterium]
MNRTILACCSLIVISQIGLSQTDSVWRISLREDALKSYEQSYQLKSYYEAVDIASRSSNKEDRKPLDSLMTDSIFLSAGLQLPLFADRILDQRYTGNQVGSNATLMSITMELDSLQTFNSFERLLLRFVTDKAEETQNEKASLILSRVNMRVLVSDQKLSKDSLSAVIENLEEALSEGIALSEVSAKKMSEAIRLWQILTVVAAAAFLVLLIVFLLVRHSIIKKLRFELSKNLDKSELQILVRKNEDLKSECEQYKKTLEEVILKMNSLNQTSRSFKGILEELNGMTIESLEFIRQNLEENKSKLSPEVYMGLTNAISRCTSSLRDEYQKTIEQLS